MNRISAIVPMKGKSVRLPNKNVKEFNGRPLFYWIINTLLNANNVDQVYVDTDSQNIGDLVRKNFPNITIIDRPEYLHGNNISMNQIIEYDLTKISNKHILQTHATNPLLSSDTVEKAVASYYDALKDNYDSLFSVTTWHKRLYDSKGKPLNHDLNKLINTQDLDPIYEENSNIYIFSKDSFHNNNLNRLGKNAQIFITPMLESIDIDYYDEFILAEACAKMTQ